MVRVLIVEDEDRYRYLFEALFHTEGYECESVNASETAYNMLERGLKRQEPFDLLVLDVYMIHRTQKAPPLAREGLELLRRIRRNPSFAALPIVGVTEFLIPNLEETFYALGGDVFFREKPDPDSFMKAVRELLEGGRPGANGVEGMT